MNDYEVLYELGHGSYGTIFKIKKGNNIMVLKEISTLGLNIKQQQAAFKEVQIMSSLNHPNIIKYLSSSLGINKIKIFMECADGDLNVFIRESPQLQEPQIWAFIIQLLEGLEYLHQSNIIHRDIKPSNILIKENQIKIGDMGVSKFGCEQQQQSRVGTPLYLAPELIKNKGYDNKIDIWALGCVIYFMCQREPPFSGQNLISLGYNIVNKSPRPINAKYTRKLQQLINKMLNKVPQLRPNATECLEFIRETEKMNKNPSGRRLKAFSQHSQPDLKGSVLLETKPLQDQIKAHNYNIYQQRLQRIVSQQKDSQQRVAQQDKFKQIIMLHRVLKHSFHEKQ